MVISIISCDFQFLDDDYVNIYKLDLKNVEHHMKNLVKNSFINMLTSDQEH